MFLQINQIHKRYGTLTVLNDVSLTLSAGQRVGLVGANGVGKSTLLKIITGELSADSGSVRVMPMVRVGSLAQDVGALTGTLGDLIDAALAELRALESEMRALEDQMGSATGEVLEAVLNRYGEVSDAFERAGGYQADVHIADVLRGLGVAHLERERDVATLSGGERTRVGLALLLLRAPEVLLLDEPTNHLDSAALTWLEDTLRAWKGAALIVSHDRAFLNRAVNQIIELDDHTHAARVYTGDYDTYLAVKRREREQWEADWQAQQAEIKDLHILIADERRAINQTKPTRKVGGDKFAKGFFKGRTEVAITRKLDNVKERLERVQADPIAKPPKPLTFRGTFDPRNLESRAPLVASGICKTYDGQTILRDIHLTLSAGGRAVIVGPNGAGKSTLLRILAGCERPDSGDIVRAGGAVIGYLDQHGGDFAASLTVVQAYGLGMSGTDDAHVSDLLNWGLFRYDEVRRPVGVLSVGQRRKLQIARLIGGGANVLLLDEPTNHLSFDVLEAFEAALRGFTGGILAVTHDRRFLEQFGGEVWTLNDGRLIV